MKIHLSRIETAIKVKALQLRGTFKLEYCDELYFDTEIGQYIVVFPHDPGNRVSGRVMLPEHAIAAAHVAEQSVPKHQAIGTKPSHDTPSGQKKKGSVVKAKSELALRAEARKAAK